MKRMRFFAVIFTILIGIVVSNFVTSEKVSAQTVEECLSAAGGNDTRIAACMEQKAVADCIAAAGTSEAKINACSASKSLPPKGDASYFNSVITSFHTAATAAVDTALIKFDGKPEYVEQQKIAGDYKSAMEANYNAYLSAYGAYITSGKSTEEDRAVDAQIAGIQAWISSMNKGDTLLKTRPYSSSSYKSAYDQYAKKVQDANTAANQIKRGIITARSEEDTSLTNATTITNAAQGNTNVAKQVAETNPNSCNLFNGNLVGCIDALFAWIITHTLLALAGWLLWITATVMNYAINVGILQFASWAPEALYPVWLVVRQITSLFVVFAGLWLGFMYIIDKGDQFKKYIPTVIIFALFVNFSYPLTRTVIDISNIISLNIYASTVGASTLEASTISVGADKTAGTLIMNKLGLVGVVDYALGDGKTTAGSLNSINSVGPALLAVLFILYAAWIFFIISVLLVTRTAVLVFLIIASPLLFVDKVIPKLGEHATKLRGTFVEMLFVGPVFTIMLALTLKFLEVFQSGPLKNGGSISSIAAGGDGAITMFFNMLMMLIMLHIMFKVTKATSGKIGEAVAGVAGKVGGAAFGGVALGGAGMLGRATLGRAAAAARDSGWMQKAQGGALGRHAYNLSDTFAKGAYDGRNSAAVKFGASKLGTNFGMGGTKGREELATENRTKLESHLGRVGVHKNNVYGADGKLIAEKGTIDTSTEALAARQRIIDGSGSVFGSKQENNDMKHQLNEANIKYALAEMSKMDTTKDETKINELLAKYAHDDKTTKKLKDAFTKKMSEEFAALDGDASKKQDFISRLQSANPLTDPSGKTRNEAAGKLINSDAQKAINEYNSQATEAAKLEYFGKQTRDSKDAINEHNQKKTDDKTERTSAAAASVAATNAVAAEQAKTTQAMVDLLAHFKATA